MSQETPRTITAGEAFAVSSLVTPTTGGNASRILAKTAGGNVTLFAFDTGAALPEHTSPFEALAFVLEGVCRFTVGGVEARAVGGTVVRLPADVPHALEALEASRMLLVIDNRGDVCVCLTKASPFGFGGRADIVQTPLQLTRLALKIVRS